MKSVRTILFVACLFGVAHATVINVPADQPTIQAGIDAASTFDTVLIAAGTYAENLLINKTIRLFGSGEALTTVYPAISDVGLDGAPSFGNSQIIVVAAHDVVIADLTLDGDNPSLTSGVVVNGADLDARNGIIEADGGPWNRTYVHNTTVKNIFLRGIYARSGGAGFSFYANTVQNVAATTSSVAIMAWMASGFIANNNVTQATDAIAANHSRGIHFSYNTVTNSGSGVHSDNNNSQGGGLPDSLIGNSVSNSTANGYGVWVFFPNGVSPVVSSNVVTNCDVGLFAWGSGATLGRSTFVGNTVDGQNRPNSIGAYVTTGVSGWPWLANVSADFRNNNLVNCTNGMTVEAEAGYSATLKGCRNSISGNVDGFWKQGGGTIIASMPSCWWGDATGPYNVTTNPSGLGNSIADNIDYSPWWGASYVGFPPHPYTWWMNNSNGSTIQEAIDTVTSGDDIKVNSGTYPEGPQIVISKDVRIGGPGVGDRPVIVPTASTGGSGDAKGWFLVQPAGALTLSDLVLDGTGYEINQGIRCYGAGAFTNLGFRNISFSAGSYQGVAVVGFGDKKVDIQFCTFENIGRIGALFFGSGITDGVFSNNKYTGKGSGDWLDYAVEVGGGAVATLGSNTITSCRGVASTDGSNSAGVLVTTYYGAGTKAGLSGNKISDCTSGLSAGYDAGDSSEVLARGGEFVGNDYGISTVAAPKLKLRVFGNYFSNTVNAEDNTGSSVWDSAGTGSGVGNCWSDWATNPGYPLGYNVPGTAGAIDHYPNVDCTECCEGTTGNVNMLGIVDLADLSALVNYLTNLGYILPCDGEANVNATGIIDLADLSALVSYLTNQGYVLPNCPAL
ncbi:hypothetical protein C3F09_08850 [candidate division GN15 bacterium]|uniref:Pectate lyase C n=1 Tax=candidate division GN15 bacterium TaxID=2072418 RepID=A0A855X4C8_9BACT|nr:MAG: hypothetical protein C3F09_08850 [candidate division GN15 bacterium]